MINYYTNTAAFAKNCVNKAKPKLHYNGKCQMMKKCRRAKRKISKLPVSQNFSGGQTDLKARGMLHMTFAF